MESKLRRAINPMPEYVADALRASGLLERYHARPPYQQNDYIGWITRGKLAATREKRLAQMLDELRAGDVYMKMSWRAKS